MKKIVEFNSDYILFHDIKRTFILTKETYRNQELGGEDNFRSLIHPIYAMIFSFFDGKEYSTALKDAALFLNIEIEKLEQHIHLLIDNQDRVYINFRGIQMIFPKNTLITKKRTNNKIRHYKASDFFYSELDFDTKRNFIPTDITLMINNVCKTDCIYCYADRRVKLNNVLNTERILVLIKEASKLRLRTFELMGGEFFLYSDWKLILEEIIKNTSTIPYISTKIPISNDTIVSIKNIGLPDIQISLDTLISENLKKILNVTDSYLPKMKETFINLEKAGIKVTVHSILNSLNITKEDMDSVYNFLTQFSNIKKWRIDVAGSSMYLDSDKVRRYIPAETDQLEVYNHLNHIKLRKTHIFDIAIDDVPAKFKNLDKQEKETRWKNRANCSGNLTYMHILPDGKVGICEELYWHEPFILGDVNHNSIMEVWNSQKALDLFYIKKENFREQSFCSKCPEFNECKQVKHVCWKEIIREHGAENWDFPDVNCVVAEQNSCN